MTDENQVDASRRGLLVATCAAGGVAGLATAGAFVSTLQPSERAKAAGAPVEVDISSLVPGEMRTVEWRGKPVWILKRTPEMIESLKKTDGEVADPNSKRTDFSETPDYALNEWRSLRKDILVVVGICPHLGCSPSSRFQSGPQPSLPDDWHGGFLCPCHGSTFDLAGRVYKNKPAPDNLQVPRYMFEGENKLVIGKDEKGEA
ncbi:MULTISPECIES: ubiquinol-cytochrome c reductase iron-sulfur subunit [Herbaspirillum]|jgi:ubiquinol-cytochrome c reductase iron-sulfur subunit|uniref:Ubiquinol-cytochrome c reductase iron-sulfur subunit n=1 Tax=Herbaspirillum frisingense GSF30 TaxID=864073 RepID=A0AAI9IIE8_9BURK|nr:MULTISPECIES: ubiquinol-cytochrome c reductase iron-sulfur subunit [Herbaspirillum]EOA06539.1 ubiquinol-cytochrome C reductase [Herbaspirillum frisingense GSF30]MCI1016219.1 ubiquinol-cytochrome c reductase iron-sulfur subunit [Herbaspirillum sp. C7C2]ONN66738.1 ubiquinol-cytochrome c reductase iron-sulfur subunit [Herbaspirillum sp. VT-16-41]QNB09146.1 ubiquinol-cytochrome c reductase iron-sulfur subunit [Herbaspirillum frisingense]UIN20853.1 ubiquinol-cytochrome c reductase iron-sulfur su